MIPMKVKLNACVGYWFDYIHSWQISIVTDFIIFLNFVHLTWNIWSEMLNLSWWYFFFQLRIGNSICNTTIRLSTLHSPIHHILSSISSTFIVFLRMQHYSFISYTKFRPSLLSFVVFFFSFSNNKQFRQRNHQVDNLLVPSPNIKDQDFVNSKRGLKGTILFPTLCLIYIYYFFLSQASSLLCI